jgi:hypothetical protein
MSKDRANMTLKAKEAIELVDKSHRELAKKLYKRICFMDKTLNQLEQQVKQDGAVITTVNGNGFDVMTEHPAQKSYNTMIGRYNAMVKSLVDMIPSEGKTESDELMNFLGGGD